MIGARVETFMGYIPMLQVGMEPMILMLKLRRLATTTRDDINIQEGNGRNF